jgi:AcrR family transcriptional regulator
MPRSGAEARQRLQQAALELYAERGYDGATTAEIAARAGVNHRTFFRHFPDKREVLFDGEDDLRDALTQSLADAPAELGPVEALLHAFVESVPLVERNRDAGAARLRLIAANPALRERDLAKGAMIACALATALERRAVAREPAELTAAVGWAAFHQAATAWVADPSRALERYLREAFHRVGVLFAPLLSAAEPDRVPPRPS